MHFLAVHMNGVLHAAAMNAARRMMSSPCVSMPMAGRCLRKEEAVNDHQRSSLNQRKTQLKRARTLLPGVDKFLGFRGAVLAKGVRRLRQLKMLKVDGKCAKTASYFPTSCLRYCSASSAMVSTVNC